MRECRMIAVGIVCASALLNLGGCMSVPTSGDAAEAVNVTDALRQRYTFPVMSKFDPTKPAAGAEAGVRETYVTVVGVLEATEQDRVLEILRDIRKSLGTKPLRVRFYREEVVTVTRTDPATGRVLGERRQEVGLLRQERIQ